MGEVRRGRGEAGAGPGRGREPLAGPSEGEDEAGLPRWRRSARPGEGPAGRQEFRCIPWRGRGRDLLVTGRWRGDEGSAVPLRIAA